MLTVVGDVSSSRVWDKSIKLVETGKINLKSLITHHFKLNDIEKALSYVEDRKDGAINQKNR